MTFLTRAATREHVGRADALTLARRRAARQEQPAPAHRGDPLLTLQRAVGMVILGGAVAGAVLVWFGIARHTVTPVAPTRDGTVMGLWRVVYDYSAPAWSVLSTAVGLALVLAAMVAVLERRIARRSRTSLRPTRLPLAPRPVMAATHGVFAGPVTITTLIPAYNEEVMIERTLASLMAQSVPPHRMIVVADNCTDRTVELSLAMGAEVIESVDNELKKAGALNQALRQVLPGLGDNDLVMVMDADTTLDDGFLQNVVDRMTADRALMAVGGLFHGEEGSGLLGQFQRNEYIRYARDLRRRRGRVFVLTGTASVFRPRALETVARLRGRLLPGVPGDVYDTVALTEDNELTLALKSLGALMISPSECTVVTEVMPTWSALWAQRLRWQRGAVENLGSYGVTPQTFRYWSQQLAIGYGVIALSSYLLLILLTALSLDQVVLFPFWMGLGGLFTLERVVSVWRGGWRARILAATLLPELLFAMVLNAVYVKGIVDLTLRRRAGWTYVQPVAVPGRERQPA